MENIYTFLELISKSLKYYPIQLNHMINMILSAFAVDMQDAHYEYSHRYHFCMGVIFPEAMS